MGGFKDYLLMLEAAANADVESHFLSAVHRGHLVTVDNAHGMSGWLGPSGTFYTSRNNARVKDGLGSGALYDEHDDLARTAFGKGRLPTAPATHALNQGMIRVSHNGGIGGTTYVHLHKKATEAQIRHIHRHAKDTSMTFVDGRGEVGLGVHENKGSGGTYLDGIRRSMSHETLAEANHSLIACGTWGLITKDGEVVSGSGHPTAKDHSQLHTAVNASRDETAEYFHHRPSDSLMVRTSSIEALGHVIKHFNRLPHGKTGDVIVDHGEYDPKTNKVFTQEFSGKRYAVLPKMRALHAERSRGRLNEMAQDAHKAGYQFHMIPDDSGCGVHTVVATHPSAHRTSAWRILGSDLRNKLPEAVRDQVVGTADIQHDERAGLGYPEGMRDKPHDLYVDSDHRRKGVASGMYDAYEKHTGRPVKPSTIQTGDARALWKDRRKK